MRCELHLYFMAGRRREVAVERCGAVEIQKADEEVEEEKAALSVNRYWYSPRANPSIGGLVSGSDYWESFARRMKTDFRRGGIGRKHQLADGVEDDFELCVIFVFPAPQDLRRVPRWTGASRANGQMCA